MEASAPDATNEFSSYFIWSIRSNEMAKNKPYGDGHRVGAVKNRSQVQAPNGHWVKRDGVSGQFMDVKSDAKPFKGVRKEK